MTEAADLARRFLALWEDYLTALFSDPTHVELLQPWVKAASALAGVPGPRDTPAGEDSAEPGPQAGAAAAAGASRGGDDSVDELARRIADLEKRVAIVERASHPRGRDRRGRPR